MFTKSGFAQFSCTQILRALRTWAAQVPGQASGVSVGSEDTGTGRSDINEDVVSTLSPGKDLVNTLFLGKDLVNTLFLGMTGTCGDTTDTLKQLMTAAAAMGAQHVLDN